MILRLPVRLQITQDQTIETRNMKLKMLFSGILACASVSAQTDDPVIMIVNGESVLRSEFEYSFNKNNSEGVIDKKNVLTVNIVA